MGDKIGGASQIGYLQSGANGPGGVGETSAAKTNGPADEVGNPNIRMIEPRKVAPEPPPPSHDRRTRRDRAATRTWRYRAMCAERDNWF